MGRGRNFLGGPFLSFIIRKQQYFFKIPCLSYFLLNMVLFFSCEKNCTYVLTRKTKIVFMFCFISFALGHKLSIIGFLSVLKVSRQRNDMKGESTKLPCLKSWQFHCKISFIRIQNFVSRFKWNNSTFLDLWIIIAIGCEVMVDSVTYYYKHFSDSFLQEEVKEVFF